MLPKRIKTSISNIDNILLLSKASNENLDPPFVTVINSLSTDEAPFISLPFEAKLIVSFALVLTLLVGTYYKAILYKGVFRTKRENKGWMSRPINVLIFVSALIHHSTHLVTCVYFILALTIDRPLQNIFGPFYFFLMTLISTFAIAYLAVGSFGTGLYRIMYINPLSSIESEKKTIASHPHWKYRT